MDNVVITLDFCAMRYTLLARGRDTAALLGRFLPRLGPLAIRERPFFGTRQSAKTTIPPPLDRAAALPVGFLRVVAPGSPYRPPAG